MKILHLSTSLSGGAGIAARRICEAQKLNGIDSQIIGGQVSSKDILKNHESIFPVSIHKKLQSSSVTSAQRFLLQNSSKLVTSFSIDNFRVSESLKNFDLVHIHANYNFIDLKTLLELSNRVAIVITLHDQRYFTGGCHYSFECKEFTVGCNSCPQVRRIFKSIPGKSLAKSIEIFQRIKNLEVISPSKWMADLAQESKVFNGKNIWIVENPVPLEFQPLNETRHPRNRLVIGFVSQNLNNPYKGLNTLIDAIRFVEEEIEVELKLFGAGKFIGKSLKSAPRIERFNNDAEAAKAYSSCDLIVVPSTQDNFPSVVTEALSCGVPVIGSKVGGIAEVLESFNLPIFDPGNVSSLVEIILNFKPIDNRIIFANKAKARFSFEKSATKHREIYANII